VITDIINFDPSIVTITRHTKVKHAGGFSWSTAVKAPIVVRIYQYTTRNMRETTLPEGEVKTVDHGLLAEVTADIKCDHACYDTFTYSGREFRVVGVRIYDDVNIDNQLQADCVAV